MDNQDSDDDFQTAGGSVAVILRNLALKLVGAAHAVRAISRLVAGVADVPTAWLEGQAERIRVDSASRSQVVRAVASAAATGASTDPQIVDRATAHWLHGLVRKQENREAVAVRTAELLEDSPPQQGMDAGPSDDFMNTFEDVAERATSENLRDLFARVLAGEIRKPGRFSRRTLHFLATIDQPLAANIQQARPLDHWGYDPSGLASELSTILPSNLCVAGSQYA